MRRKIYTEGIVNCKTVLSFVFMILFINIIATNQIIADSGERLEIVAPEEVNEEEYFSISVIDPDILEDSPWLIDVEIEFNGYIYQIDETAEIEIQAPKVNQDTDYTIVASKQGYNSTNKTIKICNVESKVLVIVHDDFVVDAGERFSVTITENDKNGDSVVGVTVAIQSFGKPALTDDNGRAWLTAPENREKITILASKDGYENGLVRMEVNIPPTLLDLIIRNRYFTLLLGTIILICTILLVNFRQRRSSSSRAKELSGVNNVEKYDGEIGSTGSDKIEEKHESKYYDKEVVRIQPNKESKVEEIRITRPYKNKKVVPVVSKEDETEKIIKKKEMQKRDYDWFEGTDDFRYEIDKLTGKIDEEGLDKWFEGVDHHKDKIKEKVKKKDKKT